MSLNPRCETKVKHSRMKCDIPEHIHIFTKIIYINSCSLYCCFISGTGKTLLARAVASQLDANFLKVQTICVIQGDVVVAKFSHQNI